MTEFKLKNRLLGAGYPTYIIAEMSANHSGSFNHAIEILHAAKEAGADCIKVQTYTPDTITINCNNSFFQIHGGLWNNETLYSLYQRAYMPWEWQGKLKEEADKIGIDFFSTPFDRTSVDFLEEIGVEFYKIASFELIDIPLIKYIAQKKKPIIMSCGMATKAEIKEAVDEIRAHGNNSIALLKCSSSYPAECENMNLATMKDMQSEFNVLTGLSDHSTDNLSSIIAVCMGGSIIEKHFCLDHEHKNPDEVFSLDFTQFKALVTSIRQTEKAIGKVVYEPIGDEKNNIKLRKSIFIVKPVQKGEMFTEDNIKVIRPGYGMHPRAFESVLGKRANCNIESGIPLSEDMIDE